MNKTMASVNFLQKNVNCAGDTHLHTSHLSLAIPQFVGATGNTNGDSIATAYWQRQTRPFQHDRSSFQSSDSQPTDYLNLVVRCYCIPPGLFTFQLAERLRKLHFWGTSVNNCPMLLPTSQERPIAAPYWPEHWLFNWLQPSLARNYPTYEWKFNAVTESIKRNHCQCKLPQQETNCQSSGLYAGLDQRY